jgi:hypothetical protein
VHENILPRDLYGLHLRAAPAAVPPPEPHAIAQTFYQERDQRLFGANPSNYYNLADPSSSVNLQSPSEWNSCVLRQAEQSSCVNLRSPAEQSSCEEVNPTFDWSRYGQ